MPETTSLSSPIRMIKGVGPRLATLLAKKGVSTLEDALYFIPRAYEDRRHITPIAELLPGKPAAVLGKIVGSRLIKAGRRQNRFEATLADKTGALKLFWFHAYPSHAEEFATGRMFLVHGNVEYFQGAPKIVHPEFERVEELVEGRPRASISFGRVVPIYSETEGLHQKTLRKVLAEVLKASLPKLDDTLPEELRSRLGLPTLRDSFVAVHFPKIPPDENRRSDAVSRIVFEEFFVLQLGLGLKKRHVSRQKAPVLAGENLFSQFSALLPFSLTSDQQAAISAIQRDLAAGHAMTRLVQGDVGCGKTVVALAAAAIAAEDDFQTAIMAPTEILAQQHLRTAEQLLAPIGITPQLVVSANSAKKETHEMVSSGNAKVVIGTHALFQSGITFKKLGLVVVDEQHRFGVEQRAELVRKGTGGHPHLLMMTATPIPRTLALTLYGDLDLTVIRQKPAGRKPVKTRILWDRDRPRLYQQMRETVAKGQQIYIIYPLVEASEKLQLKSATEMFERLRKEVFPDIAVALLHGRMKGDEKDQILADFKAGKYRMLVSTTVIEVGIDVPNATLMVIEHPERLGLSQLHQLRGRVGRGAESSQCVLVAEKYVGERLEVMEKTDDGFVIAEEDLRIRGPGEFLGTRQSGLPGFRVGQVLRDAELLSLARDEAEKLLESDPELTHPSNQQIRSMVESRWKEKIERLRGG